MTQTVILIFFSRYCRIPCR